MSGFLPAAVDGGYLTVGGGWAIEIAQNCGANGGVDKF
jgi:hypothetical protein